MAHVSQTRSWLCAWELREDLSRSARAHPHRAAMARITQYMVDPELEAELRREGIPTALVEWLVIRCPNGSRFANYADKKEERQTLIVDEVAVAKDDRGARAAQVEIWKRHEAAQDRRRGRMTAGVQGAD